MIFGRSEPRRGATRLQTTAFVLLALCCGAFGIRFPGNPFSHFIERAELSSYDLRVRSQGGVPFDAERLLVVGIDDSCFQHCAGNERTKSDAKWPFPNAWHAEVARKLLNWGAAAVAFDILSFANPSRTLYEFEDRAFADLATQSGRIVLSAKFLHAGADSWHGYEMRQHAGQQQVIRETWTLPHTTFKAFPTGYVNFPLDQDGAIRRFLPSYKRLSLFPIKPLAHEALRQAVLLPASVPAELVGSTPTCLAFSDPREIASGSLFYHQVLLASETGESVAALVARVKGRVVFVGPTFTEAHDFFFTPFTGRRESDLPTPGVYLHAMVANTLLKQLAIRRSPLHHERLLAAFAVLVGLAASLLLQPLSGLIVFCVLMLGFVIIGYAVFNTLFIWLPLASPILAALGGFVPLLGLRLIVSESRRALINKMFSAYVSKEVLHFVQDNPERLRLEGERREVSVFFSDLRGFTTISEGVSPEQLSEVMNTYLTPMTETIMAERGYLDKYIGDAIMAVFGAPMPDEQHALHACRAAILQRRRLFEVAKWIESHCGVQVAARMGINTGVVSAGNMGSQDRFQYTVMGDVVNQASRFEGANKIFGSWIMIGEPTFMAAREAIIARRLALLTVKGKTMPVPVYELLDLRHDCPPSEVERLEKLISGFHRALDSFITGHLTEAESAFQDVLKAFPDDGPSAAYIEFCHELRASGLPPGFRGEIKLDHK